MIQMVLFGVQEGILPILWDLMEFNGINTAFYGDSEGFSHQKIMEWCDVDLVKPVTMGQYWVFIKVSNDNLWLTLVNMIMDEL